ncbi:MAG: hypothetical protein K1W40_16580 [Schaedlerella sp.]|uniref:DUF5688 family protein n=1 Tax=Schaedlerella sp. TaxID=2676057 RepID=UPI003526F71B
MMSFEEFAENVVKEIRAKVGGAFQIKEHNVIKNNNVKRAGIAVMKNEEDIGPCVYLDAFYREYESDGMKFDEIVDEVYRLILKHEDDDALEFDISGFKRWETVRENVHAKLINAEQNEELLEKIPHRIFMDLAVVYYVVARDHAQEDIGTILIHNGHMEMWGQEEENLYREAMINMRTDGEADLTDIRTIVERITGISFTKEGDGASRDTGMYILTNRRNRFGAAQILDTKTLRMIADKVGDGFIVLPSSVHETIVLTPNDEEEYRRLADMVREVNDTQVDIEERLSYHVYAYSKDEEALQIVA